MQSLIPGVPEVTMRPAVNYGNENLSAEEKKKIKNKVRNTAKVRYSVVRSGLMFIEVFMKLLMGADVDKEIRTEYMERVLHSIFFFGHINSPSISPEEFIPRAKQDGFRNKFPQAFVIYLTHVPRLDPYSILLEFIENYKPVNNALELRNQLQGINTSLQYPDTNANNPPVKNVFTASVITHSTYGGVSGKKKTAHGSSIACRGIDQREIMISVSALYTWDRLISYAVYQKGESPGILFPAGVQCSAYRFYGDRKIFGEIPPCSKCDRTFKNVQFTLLCCEQEDRDWPFGNCAEYESLSKLLLARQDLRSDIVTEEDKDGNQLSFLEIEDVFKQEGERRLTQDLRRLLDSKKFRLPAQFIPINPEEED